MANISIIIPVYNKSNTIAQTIESVVHQLAAEDELLLIDDGSKDNSAEIIKQYLADNIILYQKKNGGESDARNYGIKKAKNEWLAFLDGDDLFSENYLAETRKAVQINKAYVIVHKAVQMFGDNVEDNSKKIGEMLSTQAFENLGDGKYLVRDFFQIHPKYSFINASAIVIHKNVFEKCGLFFKGMTRGADRDMFFRIFKKEFSLLYLTNSFCIRNMTDDARVSHVVYINPKHELAYLHKSGNSKFQKRYLRYHLTRRVILSFRKFHIRQGFKLTALFRFQF